MSAKLEWACEELVIQLIKKNPITSGMIFRHDDEDKDAVTNCIVVRAKCGEKQFEGAKAYPVEVDATFRVDTNSTAERNESIAEAMMDSVYKADPDSPVDACSLFSFLSVEEGGASERENGKNLRKRSRSFSFIAKEKS